MITFASCPVSEAAVAALAAAFPDPAEHARLRALVVEGKGEVFCAMDGDALAAFLVLSLDGGTLMVHAMAGPGAPGIRSAAHAFVTETARQLGCTRVRAFAARGGMLREMDRHGWTEAGRLMEWVP